MNQLKLTQSSTPMIAKLVHHFSFVSPLPADVMIHKQLDRKRPNHGNELVGPECILVHDVARKLEAIHFEVNIIQLI